MSFLFDDDNDDIPFSQSFQTSSQKQVTFSQSSSVFPSSQISSHLSPEKQSQSSSSSRNPLLVSPQQSQQQQSSQSSCLSTATKRSHRKAQKFVCQMCGTVDEYYMEGGLATCSRCFTQSQTFKGEVEIFDYDEAVHIVSRRRDGKFKAYRHAATGKRGRPAVPLEKLDRTRKPPSLEECLAGFQTVLQKSCRILCFELMAIPEVRSERDDRSSVSSDYGSDNDDSSRHNNHQNSRLDSRERKRELHHQVSQNLKQLWKAYLLSWKEGADYYSEFYPEIRFSLRDPFLPGAYRKILNYTLAARAQDTLTEKIRKEVWEEEWSDDDDSESDSDSYAEHPEDDNPVHRENKEKKVKLEPSDHQGIKTGLDALFELFHDKVLGTAKIKSEHGTIDHHVVVKSEENPVSDKASNNLQTQIEIENNCVTTGETSSVSSDLSLFDSAEIKNETKISRKRKRLELKERREAMSKNTLDKLIYYHNKLQKLHSKSIKVSMLGRKEAALMLRPSMRLVLGLLLVAASPYGLTEGQLVGWIENGSLPIFNAFSTMLSESEKETLAMIESFFTLPIIPTASNLHRIAKKIHVACEYQPPLPPPSRSQTIPHDPITTDTADFVPGRLIYPSAVPLILGQLVSDLGLSQKVLNYSLALMGLPVSRLALLREVSVARKGREEKRPHSNDEDDRRTPSSIRRERIEERNLVSNDSTDVEWLPPRLWRAHPDKLGDIHQILAVVIIACKLIPGWEKNHQYVFQRGQHSDDHFKVSDRFVPSTQEQFRYITNGKTESEYLDFLEENIFRGKNHALPKFVESLTKSPVLDDDFCVSSTVDSVNEEIVSGLEKSENFPVHHDTVVVPNELVLGLKNNRIEGNSPYYKKRAGLKSTSSKRLYQPTTLSDTIGPPNGPLGPFIEFIAVKTETCPHRILENLIELDKELVVHGKPRENVCSLPLDAYYHHIFLGEDCPISNEKSKTPQKTRKIQRSSTPSAPSKKRASKKEKSKRKSKKTKIQGSPTTSAPKKKRQSKQEKSKRKSKKRRIQRSPASSAPTKKNKSEAKNSDSDSDWDFSTQSSPQTDEHGRDFILAQRSHSTDDTDYNRISDGENDSNGEFAVPLTSSRIDHHVRNLLPTKHSPPSDDLVCSLSPSNSVVVLPV